MLFKCLLFWKGDTVDSRELFVVFVSTPVSTSDTQQLYGLYKSSIGNVTSAAQVRKAVMIAEGNLTIGQVFYQFNFVGIGFFSVLVKGIAFGNGFHFEIVFFSWNLKHFSFYCTKVFFRDAEVAQINIIIKTIFNRRSNGEFYPRIEFFQCLCQNMRRRMPECLFSFRIFPCVQYQCSITF